MFTKENLMTIRKRIEGALSEELAEYGVTSINLGRIKFSPNSFTCRLDVSNDTEIVNSGISTATKEVLKRYGIPVSANGITIKDYNPRRHRYPITYVMDNNPTKLFKSSIAHIAFRMAMPEVQS